MTDAFQMSLDRQAALPLAVQIHAGIRDAIREGRLAGGARLPSWRDLAAQLGVARGTVRVAYERLIDEQLIVSAGPAGTRVAERAAQPAPPIRPTRSAPLAAFFHDFDGAPFVFQMGVPAQDGFPYTLWSRLLARSARTAAAAPVVYPDPRGHPDLRREIAASLALARGIRCAPDQVLVTAGFSGALGLAARALGLSGAAAWQEEPGFPLTRLALEHAGLRVVPVPVDGAGIDVAAGIRRAPGAALALVTAGQQAPLGMPLAHGRRLDLLAWARHNEAWILEDDYLSELQLKGRAAPALAALDGDGRVLHAGTFSKTISPALRLGFLVVPPGLAQRFADIAACLAPASAIATQLAVAGFMAEGHYLRHLRRMKRLYAARRDMLVAALLKAGIEPGRIHATGGLAVRLDLPDGTDDLGIATRALGFGLAPVALSPWYAEAPKRHGLLLGVTNINEKRLAADCQRLLDLTGG
jgi:GntR family transcriptional regulator/MocR family aminotransferase